MIGNAGDKKRDGWETGGEGRMTKYEIILHGSGEDGAFIAEVPELAGCAADGATRQAALANVEIVIAEWLETARELGRPIREVRGRLFSASGLPQPRARSSWERESPTVSRRDDIPDSATGGGGCSSIRQPSRRGQAKGAG